MTEIERIQDQLHRAHHGNAWHGPALNELLADVTAEQAIVHPILNAHSIWELVHHIAFWESVVLQRLNGEEVSSKEVTEESNFSAAEEATETTWEKAKLELDATAAALREQLAQMTDAQLNDKVPNRKRLLYFEIHGAIQHALYHAGQIALLKKLL